MRSNEANHPEITVIIPTRNRAEVLKETLNSFVSQDTNANWELLLVDNGCIDDTRQVAASFTSRLPLKTLFEVIPGKSRALNRALGVASGRLIAFTDDDVRVSPSWLSELLRAADVYLDGVVFCGPIIPVFPPATPLWLREHGFANAAFANFAPAAAEGILLPPTTPYGPNFAVRADHCLEMQFRLDLGPSINGSFMCEDTEFIERFRQFGVPFIYLPSAAVYHQIRCELISFASLYERAFYLGRSRLIAGMQLLDLKTFEFSPIPEIFQFERSVISNLYLGQLCQSENFKDSEQSQIVRKSIEGIGWHIDPSFLGKSARDWLSARRLAL